MMGNYYGHMFGWGFGGGFMMLLFWGLIILLFVWVVREVGAGKRVSKMNSALDMLKERYARGEMDRKEFEEKKRDLSD